MKLEIGKNYFVRGSSKDYVGRLVDIDTPFQVTLAEAAWVAESGRFHEFMRNGSADGMEIEPFPGRIMMRYEEILDWPHGLFREAV